MATISTNAVAYTHRRELFLATTKSSNFVTVQQMYIFGDSTFKIKLSGWSGK